MKKALITGVTGQSGFYLAEFLLDKGYEVHGIKRQASSFNTQRIDHILQDLHMMGAKFKLLLALIEVQTGSYFDEDDIIRYEDVCARGQGSKGLRWFLGSRLAEE